MWLPFAIMYIVMYSKHRVWERIRAKRFFQSCCQFYNYMLQYFMGQNALRALFGSLSLSLLFRFRIPVARLNGMRVCAFKCVINGFYIAFVWWNSHFDRNRIGNHVKSVVFDKRTHTHTHDYEYMHLYICRSIHVLAKTSERVEWNQIGFKRTDTIEYPDSQCIVFPAFSVRVLKDLLLLYLFSWTT